jgi:endo-1,4-beta-xylanase
MGFSAGAELSSPAAVFFADFDKKNSDPGDPLAGISARPDFVGIIYPGPTPFARNANPPIPRNAPPSFIASAGSGDRGHAIWANEYFAAFLQAGIPNLEMHIYGNGRHPGDTLPDGSRMSGGLTDRNGIPFGTWQDRFIDWFRDLGFMQKPGVETKAARDITVFVSQPPRGRDGVGDRSRRGGTNAPVSPASTLQSREPAVP